MSVLTDHRYEVVSNHCKNYHVHDWPGRTRVVDSRQLIPFTFSVQTGQLASLMNMTILRIVCLSGTVGTREFVGVLRHCCCIMQTIDWATGSDSTQAALACRRFWCPFCEAASVFDVGVSGLERCISPVSDADWTSPVMQPTHYFQSIMHSPWAV